MELSRMKIEKIKEEFRPGTRVQCKHMDDPFHPVPTGTKGTVDKVDDSGTIHVKWDNGSYLGLIPEVDIFEKENKLLVNRKKEIDR